MIFDPIWNGKSSKQWFFFAFFTMQQRVEICPDRDYSINTLGQLSLSPDSSPTQPFLYFCREWKRENADWASRADHFQGRGGLTRARTMTLPSNWKRDRKVIVVTWGERDIYVETHLALLSATPHPCQNPRFFIFVFSLHFDIILFNYWKFHSVLVIIWFWRQM